MPFRKSEKKSEFLYKCKKCHYNTSIKTNYFKHLQTKKHNDNSMVTKSEKSEILSYICEKCCFNSNNKSHYDKHLQTKKHNDNSMITKSEKSEILSYICEKCCFKSNNKSHYDKHLQTKKHNDNSMITKSEILSYICICGKTYKFQSGLSRHKQTCEKVKNISLTIPELDNNYQNFPTNEIKDVIQTISTTTIDGVQPVINVHIHTGNNIYENIQTKANTVTNITNNNKTFSVKNYLNNDCKDAYNVSEVIDNFECDILKLPKKTIDFYKCLIDKAFEMETEKLPIRCSDVKRKKFFGKEDSWNNDFDVIEDFIKKLVDVVCDFRNQYSKRNPGWHDDDIVSNIMNYLIRNVTAVYDDVTCKHIISYIAEKTKILKHR